MNVKPEDMPARISGQGVDLSHLAQRSAGAGPDARDSRKRDVSGDAAGGGAAAAGIAGPVFEASDSTFQAVMELSRTVPVVVDLWAEWCGPCKQLGPVLEKVTASYDGRVVLAKVDVDKNPGLAQAFQAQSIPTVVALVAGKPVPLFQGAIPEQQVRDVYEQLLQLAVQNGVTGRLSFAGQEQDAQPQVPAAHQPALEAVAAGDYAAAVAEWQKVLQKTPADTAAKQGLASASLLSRVKDADPQALREAAANAPASTAAQLAVADLDVAGGHVEDGFARLLDLFANVCEPEDKTVVRERLLELFEVVGAADPRVASARARLAALLF